MLSLPRGTEMFQFPRFPRPVLCVQTGVTPHDGCRVSPFGHPRIDALSAAPRGLSQPHTSFIGGRRLGIHRWLFVAWKNKDARARYAVLKGPGAADASGRSLKTEQRTTGTSVDRPGGMHLRPTFRARARVASASTGSLPRGSRMSSLERR